VLYQKWINDAAGGISDGQVITTPIPELIKYVTTPHDHNLVSTRIVRGVNVG